jgi:hypothetical protein
LITKVAAGAFADMPALRMVSLEHNVIRMFPTTLPPHLSTLNLKSNNVFGVPKDAFGSPILKSTGTDQGGNAATATKRAVGTMQIAMEGNPTTCIAAAVGAMDASIVLQCVCGEGYAGDGTFCLPKPTAADVCTITDSTTTPQSANGIDGSNTAAVAVEEQARADAKVAVQSAKVALAQLQAEYAVALATSPAEETTDESGDETEEEPDGATAYAEAALAEMAERVNAADAAVVLTEKTLAKLDAQTGRAGTRPMFVVDCSDRRLAMMPFGVPHETTHLMLQGNALEYLRAADFTGLENLRELNLSGNKIAWIGNDLFAGLNRLEKIDLTRTDAEMDVGGGVGGGAVGGGGQCGHVDAFTELPHSALVILAKPHSTERETHGQTSGEHGRCNRDESRVARRKIAARVLDGLRELGTDASMLLLSCPLLPHADVYRVHEQAVRENNGRGMPCGYCGKQFRDQRFLDLHFEHRHMDKMVPHAHNCPHDYCDIVGCQCVSDCSDEVVSATRGKCRSTLTACFATMDAQTEQLVADACDTLDCEVMQENCAKEQSSMEAVTDALGMSVFAALMIFFFLFICVCYCVTGPNLNY